MAQSTKKRAQGAGRTSNSEPRQQVFRDFNGCNFSLSPRDFTLGKQVDQEQSDLQMNYVVVQDNARVTPNKTIETRNNLVKLFDTPTNSDAKFTDACILIKDELFVGMSDESLMYTSIVDPEWKSVTIQDKIGSQSHHWESFEYVDNKIVGTTTEQMLWSGLVSEHKVANAKYVSDPGQLVATGSNKNFTACGSLTMSETYDAVNNPFRISVSIAYINKYGPTAAPYPKAIYVNIPIDEWHTGQYLRVHGTLDATRQQQEIEAVEIYYTAGNANDLQFAGRVDLEPGATSWTFNWFGYLDATYMWPIANLIAPTENVTQGVKASHVKCIDSRLYFWGGTSNPQRLWIGGNPGNLLSISPGTGGGFVDVEPGTGQEIRVVTKYKTQGGASIVTMLCDSKNSMMEQRFNLVENTISLSNEQSMKSWQAEQVAGSVGVKGFHGALVCEDGLYSISRYGLALTTMTMEYNSQIRTNYVSDPIKPIFTDKLGSRLKDAIILECDGVIYVAFGKGGQGVVDNILFCYDIDLKAWWSISLDIEEQILNMFHVDYEGAREGIGIVTADHIYLLPLTQDDDKETDATFAVTIQTGELATTQPQQNWQYLSQMEFRFDYFIGNIVIELTGIDQFGRKVKTRKRINHNEAQYNLAEYMRVDLRLQSYQIRITGQARFRMSHFIAKVYTMSSKQGIVWGFDDSQSFRSQWDIHPTFKDYNDIRKAIIP